MNRRRVLEGGGLTAAALAAPGWARATAGASAGVRIRPGEPGWPSGSSWEALGGRLSGSLARVPWPFESCRGADGATCEALFKELKNPYFIRDQVGLAQTLGWVDAWTLKPSAYAVTAANAQDVATAVGFARDNNLRLVIRGGGHSYLGASNAADSLLIWTRRLDSIELHDAFVAQGCGPETAAPAVSVGAGAIWMHLYDEVTTRGGRYVQGGGCGTVGVAGLVLGGGFGSYTKTYGVAAGSLLEAEVVTADGRVRVANARRDPDLFWALGGGGGGTFGVVTRLTLRTHELPGAFGIVALSVRAIDPPAFEALVDRFLKFYAAALMNPSWGEIANLTPGRSLDIEMAFLGVDEAAAAAIWLPFLQWLAAAPDLYAITRAPLFRAIPARRRWDPAFLRTHAPEAVRADDRPQAGSGDIFWTSNLSEAGHYINGYASTWLPVSMLQGDQRRRLVSALVAASRLAKVELHFQKGLAGGGPETIAGARATSVNPAVLDAFALAIAGSEGPPAYPGAPGHEPDLAAARRGADAVARATAELRKAVPAAASYPAESNYFEPDWQGAYWGEHYPRLLAVKRRYDPDGLFFVRHGVGSEGWSDDGFRRV